MHNHNQKGRETLRKLTQAGGLILALSLPRGLSPFDK